MVEVHYLLLSIPLALSCFTSSFSILMWLPLFIRLQMFSVCLHFSDVDECQNNSSNNCEQLCVNFPASFFCDCGEGYELNDDGRSCDGKIFPE